MHIAFILKIEDKTFYKDLELETIAIGMSLMIAYKPFVVKSVSKWLDPEDEWSVLLKPRNDFQTHVRREGSLLEYYEELRDLGWHSYT